MVARLWLLETMHGRGEEKWHARLRSATSAAARLRWDCCGGAGGGASVLEEAWRRWRRRSGARGGAAAQA
jgi:hypothetical protein